MTTRTAPSKPSIRGLAERMKPYLVKPCSTAELARKLGVSTATASRGLAGLRRLLAARGARLVSIRDARGWHYEILPSPDAWRNDPFFRSLGLVPGVPRSLPRPSGHRPPGQSIDDA